MNPPVPTERLDPRPYRNRRIAAATCHGKHRQWASPFGAGFGARLVAPPDLDTDLFGTFTGDRPRDAAAADVAVAKARLGMRLAGLGLGLASEATYGPLRDLGWCGHEEIMVFVDDDRGIEVLQGFRTTEIPGLQQRVSSLTEVRARTLHALADQAVIVRPATDAHPADVVKGITNVAHLRAVITGAARRSSDGRAVVEPDLRAHHNPSRRAILTRLATTLARRLATTCPACATPGFGRVATSPGLPCRWSPTPQPAAAVHGCSRCPHRRVTPIDGPPAAPKHCPSCNP